MSAVWAKRAGVGGGVEAVGAGTGPELVPSDSHAHGEHGPGGGGRSSKQFEGDGITSVWAKRTCVLHYSLFVSNHW